MKTEIERILEQVHRSHAGDAWHGPSVSEALLGVYAATATLRAAPGTHSIAEIATHLEHTQQVVIERIEGRGRLTSDEESWPTVPDSLSDAEWLAIQHSLHVGAAALEHAISRFPLDQLGHAPGRRRNLRIQQLSGSRSAQRVSRWPDRVDQEVAAD